MALTLAEFFSVRPLLPLTFVPLYGGVTVEAYPSGKAWRCATGKHRWHRSEDRAKACKFSSMPMKSISWRQFGQPYANDGPVLELHA